MRGKKADKKSPTSRLDVGITAESNSGFLSMAQENSNTVDCRITFLCLDIHTVSSHKEHALAKMEIYQLDSQWKFGLMHAQMRGGREAKGFSGYSQAT